MSERAIRAAEQRLGAPLPSALRTLHLRTGKVAALHATHNRLVALDDLGFVSDHLVIYEENQAAIVWGIARSVLAEDDPPVAQGQPRQRGTGARFKAEFRSVSEFAAAQGAWQAVQGGLPFVGVWQQPARGQRVDARSLTRALGPSLLVTTGMRAWLVAGGVAVLAGRSYLGLATRKAAQFRAASARLGVELDAWDWATVQDQ